MFKKFFWSKYMTWFRKLIYYKPPIVSDKDWNAIVAEMKNLEIEKQGWKSQVPVFSGSDIKCYIKPRTHQWIYVPEIFDMSCIFKTDNSAEGTISFVVFDKDIIHALPASSSYTIVLEAANEYGHLAHMKLDEVEFGKRQCHVNAEHTHIKMTTSFKALRSKPWTSEKNSPIEKTYLNEPANKRLNGR
jgi:hypothetical protein